MRRRPLAAGLAIALALSAAGCRDDETTVTGSSATTDPAPLTISPTSTAPDDTAGPTTTSPTTTPTTTDGAPPATTAEDSEDTDLPPEPGSPEEAFEQECEKHPERCG